MSVTVFICGHVRMHIAHDITARLDHMSSHASGKSWTAGVHTGCSWILSLSLAADRRLGCLDV